MASIKPRGITPRKNRFKLKDLLSNVPSIALLIFTIYFASLSNNLNVQNNELSQRNLELQNQLYNFPSVIVAPDVEYSFFNSSDYGSTDGHTTLVTFYGYVKAEIKLVTPHFGSLSVKLGRLILAVDNIANTYLDIERLNQTEVSYVFEPYADLAGQGLNQFNPNLHLKASAYLNSSKLPGLNEIVYLGNVGRLSLDAVFKDFQTNTTVTKAFNAYLTLRVKMSLNYAESALSGSVCIVNSRLVSPRDLVRS